MRFVILSALFFAACGTATSSEPMTADHAADHATVDAPAEPMAQTDAEWATFGEPMTSDNTVSLSDLLDNPETYTGQTVRVEGTIADVCQMAGCWMVMADGERTMRVTMKDHGFAVDKGAATRTGIVEGEVIARPADPERAAHFASESANPDAMPENSGAEMLYEINASGVHIKNG